MSWIDPIMQNLISSILAVAILKLLAVSWSSRASIKGVAIRAAKPTMAIVVRVARDIFIFWFLLTQLRGLLTEDAPMTRGDVFLISFWLWWLMFYLAATLRLGINTSRD